MSSSSDNSSTIGSCEGHFQADPTHDTNQNRIINPYKQLKKAIIPTPSTKETLTVGVDNVPTSMDTVQITMSDEDCQLESWEDTLTKKNTKTTRIYFQNINGIGTKSFEKWYSIMEWLKQQEVDLCGLAETNANTANARIRTDYINRGTTFCKRASIMFAPNTNPSDGRYQPGGTALICNESWKSRILHTILDKRKWGRYVGNIFRIKRNYLLGVLCVYRCIKKSGYGAGKKTTVRHQREGIDKLGMNTSVRQLCLNDLTEEIKKYKDMYGNVIQFIVMIDANESLTENHSQLHDFLRITNLIEPLAELHPNEKEIATHKRANNRRIDFIFCSKDIQTHISRGGYLSFLEGPDSDHRGVFIDLHLNHLKDNAEYIAPSRLIGSHESTETILKYQNYIDEKFRYHKIYQKAEHLSQINTTSSIEEVASKRNRFDMQITEIVLSAEKNCSPIRHSTRWNPNLANISLVIKYFKQKRLMNIETVQKSSILQHITKRMWEPYKSEILEKIPLSTAPNKGLELALKLKKEFITLGIQSREDDEYNIKKRNQQGLTKETMQLQTKQKNCFRNINYTLERKQLSGIKTIDIPQVDHNNNSSWITISDPEEINHQLVQRNIKHFGQASETPFVTGLLRRELGYRGTNQACIKLLNGILPQSYHHSDTYTKLILERLTKSTILNTIKPNLSFEEFRAALHNWNEKTSTSPSGRHLGHYKCLLLDVQDAEETVNKTESPETFISKATQILKVYWQVIQTAATTGTSLQRWQVSHTSMIQKSIGISRIDRLRVIHLYEADYNLFLKIFWGRKLVRQSEDKKQLNEGQYGSRPGKRCIDQVIKKVMVYQYSSLTRTSMATMDNDAKSCFDRIVCVLAMLISMFFGITWTIVNVHATTLRYMKYYTKTSLGPSKQHYQHRSKSPIHGTGQGSCASPALWLHISSFLMDILANHSFGFVATSVQKDRIEKINNQGFVDDTSLMTNGGNTSHELIQRLQQDAQTWNNLLFSSGGKLELNKCLYYIISFKFDATGNPTMYTPEHEQLHLSIQGSETNHPITLMQPHQAHKTLGCFRSLDGNETEQYKKLMHKVKDWAHKLSTRFFTRYEAWTVYHSYYMPQLLYSMAASDFTRAQCDNLQAPVVQAILPLLGFNRNTVRTFVFGPNKFGGLGLADLYTETYTQRIESLIVHTRSNTSIGNLMIINLGLINLLTGKTTSYLESSVLIKYIQKNWFTGIHEFLVTNDITVKINDVPVS
jgi:Reverse transcriptase (RNA-dependent DNA polymerase)